MTDARRGPAYLAEALEKVLAPSYDKYLAAAAAYLYPKTIQNILTRKPVAQVTLEKVGRALKRGELCPRTGASGLAKRLYRFLQVVGGTAQAASYLSIDPFILAKLICGRQVNGRFRALIGRRLEKVQGLSTSKRIVLAEPSTEHLAEDSLAHCRQAYELYKSHGTLEAVGRQLNLSRERVRQLINRGVAYGVIPAEPHYTRASRPFPFSSREEFLAAYRKTPSMCRLVQNLHISKQRLKRFCRAHAILRRDLESMRRSSAIPRSAHAGAVPSDSAMTNVRLAS
jgi:ribosomal protein S14